MAGTKRPAQTALSFNTEFLVLSATLKNTLTNSGYMKPRSPSLPRGIIWIFHIFHDFQMPESKSLFLLLFFFLRISPAFHSEEQGDESCSFCYRVCKLIERPGFKHREQLGKMAGSCEMTHRIGWKRLQMLKSSRDKEKAKVFTQQKIRHSMGQLRLRESSLVLLLCLYVLGTTAAEATLLL